MTARVLIRFGVFRLKKHKWHSSLKLHIKPLIMTYSCCCCLLLTQIVIVDTWGQGWNKKKALSAHSYKVQFERRKKAPRNKNIDFSHDAIITYSWSGSQVIKLLLLHSSFLPNNCRRCIVRELFIDRYSIVVERWRLQDDTGCSHKHGQRENP